MTDYRSNSHKSKEKVAKEEKILEKKVDKVVTGEVITRKKPLGKRFREVFLGGEFRSAGEYLVAEVLLPAFRNLLVDATTKGVERVVYGDSGYARSRPAYDGRPRMTYNRPVNRSYSDLHPLRPNLPDQPTRNHRRGGGEELILGNRRDAELILERLQDVIDQYDVASVADLHELGGVPSSHVDQKWGWETLASAEIRQIRDGYLLDLPPAHPI